MVDFTKFTCWDLETSGVNKYFDAPVDIGVVTTDEDLQPMGELSLSCRPSIYSLPAPGALRVTGVGINELMSREYSLRKMMLEAQRHFETLSPTCFLTYNGIAFDDEMYRHTAYRNLMQPYAMQFNGNKRLDLMILARVAHVLRPGCINVPIGPKGNPTFRLDALAPANGFDEDNAHNAVVDARATVHVARQIKTNLPELWETALEIWTDKHKSRAVLENNDFVIQVGWNAFKGKPIVKALVPIGLNPGYASEYACIDLGLNEDDLNRLSVEDMVDAVCIGTKARHICPIKLNAMPVIFDPTHPLVADILPGTLSELRARAKKVRQNAFVMGNVPRVLEERRNTFVEPEYVEQKLYSGGFVERQDTALAARFHMADPTTRVRILDEMQDERLLVLGQRILFEESPGVLPLRIQSIMTEEIKTRLHTHVAVPWTSISSAREEINKMMDDSTLEQRQLLAEYETFLANLPSYFPQAA